jgi:hypothetical protein
MRSEWKYIFGQSLDASESGYKTKTILSGIILSN